MKKVLEVLKTQSEDENVAAFIQAIRKFQTMKASDQSQSAYEREMNEMRVVMAAFQSLPEEARAQFVFITAFIVIVTIVGGILGLLSSVIDFFSAVKYG